MTEPQPAGIMIGEVTTANHGTVVDYSVRADLEQTHWFSLVDARPDAQPVEPGQTIKARVMTNPQVPGSYLVQELAVVSSTTPHRAPKPAEPPPGD